MSNEKVMQDLGEASSDRVMNDYIEEPESSLVASSKPLTLLEGVALIVGTNIGAGVLAIPAAARHTGFMPLFMWLIIIGIITTITMLYVAETTLRTRGHFQLSGLALRYIGPIGAWLIFISVFANTTGALIAYMTGSGDLINALSIEIFGGSFTIPKQLGSIIFAIPAIGVLYIGLKAMGQSGKYISLIMVLLIIILSVTSFFHPNSSFLRIFEGSWSYTFMIPVMYLVVFSYSAQYIVPEIARGFVTTPKLLPKAIVIGMFCTFVLLSTVAFSVITLAGIGDVDDIATLTWGRYLGKWAMITANLFALCAMLTSYWGLGGSYLTNIFDHFKLGAEDNMLKRGIVLAIIAIPPFILAYTEKVTFGGALGFAGAVGGIILAITPIIMLKNARKNSAIQPEWQCNRFITSLGVKIVIVVLYGFAALYTILEFLDLLPKGWG